MTPIHQKSHGDIIDELIVNGRRLAIAHLALGVASAFAFLSRPGILHPSLRAITGFRAGSIDVIFHAAMAWLPYGISWALSRAVLSGRNKNATLAFIVCAIAITVISFRMTFLVTGPFDFSALTFSAIITIALAAACGLCAIIWGKDA
jgi:hypothetical protein